MHPRRRPSGPASTPALAAATRKTSGSGLPRVMSSSEAIAANRPSRPHSRNGQLEVRPHAARADRQPHARGRQGVEHLANAVHQGDLARGRGRDSIPPSGRSSAAISASVIAVAQQQAEDARIGHAERLVDELGGEAQAGAPAELDPGRLVRAPASRPARRRGRRSPGSAASLVGTRSSSRENGTGEAAGRPDGRGRASTPTRRPR